MGAMERVRWGNVLRALAAVAVLGLVVAWPLLAPEAPRVPSGRERPVVTPAPVAPMVTPPPRKAAPRPARRRPKPRVVRRERRAGKGGGGSGRVTRRPSPLVTPAAAVVVPPAPVAPPVPVAPPPQAALPGSPAPADPDPVLREFGPESG